MRIRPRKFTSMFFPSGDLDGPRVARLDRWDGVAVWGPHGQLDKFLERKELDSPGIYLLRGPGKRKKTKIYIGKTTHLRKRIKQHRKTKDWWTEVVAIASDKKPLNPTYIGFLEEELVKAAQKSNRITVENNAMPDDPDPSDEDLPAMEDFLDGIKDILPLIHIKDFVEDDDLSEDDSRSPVRPFEQIQKFEMKVPVEKGIATARYNKNTREFIVQKGSHARSSWVSSKDNASEKRHRQRLLDDGSLKIDSDGACRFTEDVVFKTASAAAGIIAGAPVGHRQWKVSGTNRMFKEWLDAQREQDRSHEQKEKIEELPKHSAYTPTELSGQTQKFEMRVPTEGGTATARYDENSGEFIVQRESRARSSWAGRNNDSEQHHRQRLLDDGSLKIDSDGVCRFTKDVTFKTPSAAAGVIAGMSVGRNAWKVPGTKTTFKDWLNDPRRKE